MKLRWAIAVIVGLGFVGTTALDTASARPRHKAYARCVDRPTTFSWEKLIFGGPPRPNGCAPAVFDGGRYVGQDPDPFIRLQLRRDPRTGYFPE